MIKSLVLEKSLRDRIASEALKELPRECCGLIEGMLEDHGARAIAAHPVRNLAEAPDRFEIDPAEHIRLLRKARETGRAIIGCYHSHPNGKPEPSSHDRENASDAEFIWLIAAVSSVEIEMRAFVCNDRQFSSVPLLESKPAYPNTGRSQPRRSLR